MVGQILAIVGQTGKLIGLDIIQRIGQGHVTVSMMMAVTFAVGGDIDQLGILVFI